MAWTDREWWLNYILLGDGRVEDKTERDERSWGKSSCDTSTWENFVCKSIYHPRYSRNVYRSGLYFHWYDVLPTQLNKWYPWFLISTRILHIVFIRSPTSLFLVHHSTIIAQHKVMSSLSISPCHDFELTPSTAYTQDSIHCVQHTPSVASTQDCWSSLHSHDTKLTPECSFNFQHASLYDPLPSPSSPWKLQGKVTLSHSHSSRLTNWWILSQGLAPRPSTASKYLSKITRLHPPSSLDHRLDVHLQTHTITVSKCLSILTRLRPPNLHTQGLQVHFQTRSITASQLTQLWPPKCICEVAQLWSPSSRDYGLPE